MSLDRSKNWERNVPFFLFKLGAMQGWMDMLKAVDSNEFENSSYDFVSNAFVIDLFEDKSLTKMPSVPALAMSMDLDGTNSPSYENATHHDTSEFWRREWPQDKIDAMKAKPVTDKNAPNVGQFNNAIPTMFLDMDPTVVNQYHAIVYINVETRAKSEIMPNKAARATRFDNRNNAG